MAKKKAAKTTRNAGKADKITKSYTHAEIKTKANILDSLLNQELPDSDGAFNLLRTRKRFKKADELFEEGRQTILQRHAKSKDGKLLPTGDGQPQWHGADKDEQAESEEKAKESIAALLDRSVDIEISLCPFKDLLDEDGDLPEGKGMKLLLFQADDFISDAPWQDADESADEAESTE